MIYTKLSQLQRTLAITLAVVGTCITLPLPGQTIRANAESAQAGASTLVPAPLASSSLLLPSQTVAQSLLTPSRGQVTPFNPFFKVQVAQAQSSQANRLVIPRPRPDRGRQVQAPPPPPPVGAPADGQRVGGASRGNCPRVSKPLTALIPVISATRTKSQNPNLARVPAGSVLGLTVAERPTFWVYYPYSATSSHSVEFVLQDEQGNEIYQTLLSDAGTKPGVVGFQLPSTAPALDMNKRYRWFFSVYCEPDDSTPTYVSGWVQRVPLDPSLKRQIEQATPQQRVALYNQADIWQEAVTALAELRRQKPNDARLNEEWVKLMQSIDLASIAPEPVTSMLTPKR